MRGRYGIYAVPALFVTTEFSTAYRQLLKTRTGFHSEQSLIPVSLSVTPYAPPRPSIRQTGRDDEAIEDWRRDSRGERRREIAGRWTGWERDAIGQLGRDDNRRPIDDLIERLEGRGAKPSRIVMYFFIAYVSARKLHETALTDRYVTSIIAFPH